jgi:D-sedoheptulose 7-phosphate isomerase
MTGMAGMAGSGDGAGADAGDASGYVPAFLDGMAAAVDRLDPAVLEQMVDQLVAVKAAGGRVFFVGVGGSAANASHAVNDFRIMAGIESYAPCDNVAELTARTNDVAWETSLAESLRASRVGAGDVVVLLSVSGGGHDGTSPNIAHAARWAKAAGATTFGIVGTKDCVVAEVADVLIVVDAEPRFRAPFTEAVQAVVSHLLASHPRLG